MITKRDLQQAIAECQGGRNPNASTCAKLASFYTIMDHMEEPSEDPVPKYSYDPGPTDTVQRLGNTEFLETIQDKKTDSVLLAMDELMDTLKVISPRLYNGMMRKLKEVG